ncbi:MAG: hypothetical protein QOG14_2556, partial [Mycobacterium sp.]|nr:hypothetical protein [Mycobacterium sp.]
MVRDTVFPLGPRGRPGLPRAGLSGPSSRPSGVPRRMDRGSHRCLAVRHDRVMLLVLRRGLDSDAETIAELYLRARQAALPAIPAMVHTAEETRCWIEQQIVPETELWIAQAHDGTVVGMLVLDGDCVDQLYVEPELTGLGIGSEMI